MVEVVASAGPRRARPRPRIYLFRFYESNISIYSLDGFDNKLDYFSTKRFVIRRQHWSMAKKLVVGTTTQWPKF